MTELESQVFLTKTKKQRVYEFLEKKPKANIFELYFEFPQIKKEVLKNYKCEFLKLKNDQVAKSIKIVLSIFQKGKITIIQGLSGEEREAIKVLEDWLGNRKV